MLPPSMPGRRPIGRRLLLSALPLLALACTATAQPARPSLAQPSLSPDGHEIAFVSGGDIWTVPANGGEAHLLISDPADDTRPLWSPDGTRLAFNSTRTGANDIYVLTLATGALQRLTFSDSAANLDAWSPDGQYLYFYGPGTDAGNTSDVLRVKAAGGTPMVVSGERYLNEFFSAPSPNGREIALVAKGISGAQWWRNGHAHIDEGELWIRNLDAPTASNGGFRQLVGPDAKHLWPMWSADGSHLLFMSDRSGSENLWEADASTGTQQQLTHFKEGRFLWPQIGDHGQTVVFERDFHIWKANAHSGKAEEVKIELRGSPAAAGTSHVPITSWTGLALSPDGRKVVVAGHGEIFAASAKDGGDPQRLTHTDVEEDEAAWSADSNQVFYVREHEAGSAIFSYNFTTETERPVVQPSHPASDLDYAPTVSPDGKQIAFLRNRKELHVLTLASMKDAVVARGEINRSGLTWSPDSKWIAYMPTGTNGFSNLWVVPADASAESQQITFLANGQNGSHVAWSPDGTYILFDTSQRAEVPQLARVDLIPHVPVFREDQFRELFRKEQTPGTPDLPPDGPQREPAISPVEPSASASASALNEASDFELQKPSAPEQPVPRGAASKAPPKPVKIVFADIHERLTLVPVADLGIRSPVISPDGKTLAFLASSAGQQNVYTMSLDEHGHEPAVPKQLTSSPGSKNNLAFSPDSKLIYFLAGRGVNPAVPPASSEENGPTELQVVTLATRMVKPVPLTASLDVDFDREKTVVFEETWSTLDHVFFRSDFNGHNWDALRAEWQPLIAGTHSGPELRRDINLMIGELNSSHSGISKPSAPGVRTGRLGVHFDRTSFESSGSLVIQEITPLGPLALEGSIKVGDRILAVDGQPVTANINVDALLEDRAGRRTLLSIAPAGDLAKKHDVIVRPVTAQVDAGLMYRAWVKSRRELVDKLSGGKLGYVHLAAMGDADLAQLYMDLDAANQAKQGVVVDVRNNNGGYVNGRVIDVLSRRNYLLMTPRDGSTTPSRQALGQRALGLPTVLLTNESTLSDGEDFTEGYRTLGLGKIVGTPTAGWIIFTGSQKLIDGSQVRTPGTRIKNNRDEDMELHPRPVDVEQLRAPGETADGVDSQLAKAVQVLLGESK